MGLWQSVLGIFLIAPFIYFSCFQLVSGCDPRHCQLPKCHCYSTNPPRGLSPSNVPQLVMLTFDDAVSAGNIAFYRELLNEKRKNKANGCRVGATFFVSHEYTDYAILHQLVADGHEVASHSISHVSSTDKWKSASQDEWKDEIAGMRTIMSTFGQIDAAKIQGHRAPFLQTAGNLTFRMLDEEGFKYDSSLPIMETNIPPWPFTLDYGFPTMCRIQPCPNEGFSGLWEIPLINWFRTAQANFHQSCSMIDACLPSPETAKEMFEYMKHNFDRHYLRNKAPFPVFVHEAWLKDEARKEGYLKFVDWLLEKDDVFLVTVQEVLHYMQNPMPLSQYKQKTCIKSLQTSSKCQSKIACNFEKTALGGPRLMYSCIPCPSRYPWVENPLGIP